MLCRYIGRKTRIDAEVALHMLKDGVFLIRESMDRPGEYAVALRWVWSWDVMGVVLICNGCGLGM